MRRHKCPLVFLLSILNIDAFSSVHQEEREREMLVKDKQQKRWWVAYFSCHFSKGEMQVNLVFIMAEDWTGTYWAAINHEFHHGLSRFSYWPEWPSLLPLLLHSLSLLPFLLSLSLFVCYPLALYFYLKLYDRYFLCVLLGFKQLWQVKLQQHALKMHVILSTSVITLCFMILLVDLE